MVGTSQSGKSSVCSYLAQQLGERIAARRCGDMLAGFRLNVARDGESKAEEEIEKLMTVPILVIDDLDRPTMSRVPASPFTLRESCGSYDLLRLSGILRGRTAARLPTIVTSRCDPGECADRTLSIKSADLVRALLSTASGGVDPIEDFPAYVDKSIRGAVTGVLAEADILDLGQASSFRVAA